MLQLVIRLCSDPGHDGQETSSESKSSNEEEGAPCDDEDAEADKGDAEVLSIGQAASDGDEG